MVDTRTTSVTHGPSGDRAALALLAALAVAPETRAAYSALKDGLKSAVAADPFDATVGTVLGGAALFYLAEKGHNPKVTTYWDALVFVSTCLSVGYADVFARTAAGKAIASALMTFGPALSGAVFETPRDAVARSAEAGSEERSASQKAIVDRLDAILAELRAAKG